MRRILTGTACSLSLFLSAASGYNTRVARADDAASADATSDKTENGQPGDKVLKVGIEPAFSGRTFDRPVLVTHAGDQSGKIYVVEQKGRILMFDEEDQSNEPEVVLDIRERVRYSDRQNEEGLLGLAFHPDFKNNGQLVVYYSKRVEPASAPGLATIARFTMVDGVVDIDSEEVLLEVEEPYWNHAGGTVLFGPDGYLYVTFGDGGLAKDPHDNGQNLETLLGTILRIDVDKKANGRPYAIPADNPFVETEKARPEIYAYGLRNVWRMAFDRATGVLWAGDVGQDLWEEIDIIEKGGNYGWNRREGLHPFGDAKDDAESMVDPILEYHHDVGKSITGGHVYRGKDVPTLIGKYLYADYVGGQIWALDYDFDAKRVIANYRIPSPSYPIMSFGENEAGESYFMDSFGQIYRFVPKE